MLSSLFSILISAFFFTCIFQNSSPKTLLAIYCIFQFYASPQGLASSHVFSTVSSSPNTCQQLYLSLTLEFPIPIFFLSYRRLFQPQYFIAILFKQQPLNILSPPNFSSYHLLSLATFFLHPYPSISLPHDPVPSVQASGGSQKDASPSMENQHINNQ